MGAEEGKLTLTPSLFSMDTSALTLEPGFLTQKILEKAYAVQAPLL